ncbi:penicillin acylase family protein [Pontimicrobium sp. IMCC45349]|uniref:penicillin acylase family protein n=1 Tax=Pontimicrobium sp. IMCC45349 TaxID=3391574 RepID=UPI00399F9832
MKSILKKVLVIVGVLVVLLVIGGFAYMNFSKPQYSGSLELKYISQETTTYFDTYGIPHIYAQNQEDAYTTLGYVHAQDRLWQMELMRRIAPGRLSEILGKDLLKTDTFFVHLGIEEASKKAIDNLDKNSDAYKLSMAYLNGVNQFIDDGSTPIEFTLVGVEKEHYELKDVYNIFGYMAFSFAMAQKTDPMLSAIQEKLGIEYLKDLDVEPTSNCTLIHNSNPDIKAVEALSTDIASITNKLPIPAFIGSNSWVVAPQKTKSGSVLFANDPHIGYAQPAVWYEAHIATPDYEMYGYHLAGVPFPLLGHNRDYAYGLTMFENDDIDFYQETNHPSNANKYKTSEGYVDYSMVSKTIKVKDDEPVVVEVKSSHHGPIMNGIQDEISQEAPIALSWVYTKHDIKVLEAVYKLSHAKSMSDAKEGASLIHAPGLNVMYGDAKGNVAWWAAGLLYKFNEDVNPKFILDGASGNHEPIEYINFKENPMAENPEWHYVYSANNQPDSIANMLYPGYYLPEDRAKRIVHLLERTKKWDKEGFSKMINDNTSAVIPSNVKALTKALNYNSLTKNQQRAMDMLQLWEGDNNIDDIAPTIYQRFVFRYLENTFKDELGEELFNQLLKTHLIKRSIALQINNETSVWWDDVTTDAKEQMSDIVNKSFIEAVTALETEMGADIINWKWGKVHTLEHPHALGAVESLKPYFNVGPFEVGGTEEVIDNKAFDFNNSGLYPVKAGPSTRRIIDFSDVENSISILPTGQSGNPFSKHYDDQAEMYNKGEFRKMLLNKDEIVKSSTLLEIKPKQ